MSGFWSGLTGKLAEKWLTLLVLPGALYLATATTAHILGHTHALGLHRFIITLTTWAKNPTATTTGGQIVLIIGVLLAAAATGLLVQALAAVTEQLTLATGWQTWPRPLRGIAARRTRARRTAWNTAHTRYHQLDTQLETLTNSPTAHPSTPSSADILTRSCGDLAAADLAADTRRQRDAAFRERVRISLEEPQRPTWSGDRIDAVTVRLERDFHLHLPTLWPYLWLTLPDTARTELTTARTQLTQATTLLAWTPVYLTLTLWWWPAFFLAAGIALTGRRRLHTAADTYAQLLEATTRLHLTTLADHLGIDTTHMKPHDLGQTLTHRFHTQPPPPPTGDGGSC